MPNVSPIDDQERRAARYEGTAGRLACPPRPNLLDLPYRNPSPKNLSPKNLSPNDRPRPLAMGKLPEGDEFAPGPDGNPPEIPARTGGQLPT